MYFLNNKIRSSIKLGLVSLTAFSLYLLSPSLPSVSAMPVCSSTEIGGTVYRDYNLNGVYDSGETIFEGITVNVYDDTNLVIATGTTNTLGEYVLGGLTSSTEYRVEFEIPDNSTTNSDIWHGAGDSSVKFGDAGDCTVDSSVNNPSHYCHENTGVSVACFLQAQDSTAATWTDEAAIVQIPYESGSTDMTAAAVNTIQDADYMNVLATMGEVGSVFGLAYDTDTATHYTSAFMKRHVPYGPGGPGAIYKVTSSAVTTFADINSLLPGTPAGTDQHVPSGNNYTSDQVWDAVGKTGFGNLILSEDGSEIYTVTMTDSDRKLYKIDIPSDGSNPMASDITTYDLPSPATCPNHPSTGAGELNYNIRPGALKYEGRELYVGLTCTAESTAAATDLEAYVYMFDLDNETFGASPIFTFPLDYPRLFILDGGTQVDGEYNPWVTTETYNGPTANSSYPMPWFIDMDFSDDGCMVLGIADRYGHLAGGNHNAPFSLNGNAGGDILKACNLAGTWTLENNANDGVNPTTGGAGDALNAAGPGNGEFFYQENMDLLGTYHDETSNGGLGIFRGKDEVILGVFDPAPFNANLPGGGPNTFDSGGLIYMSTSAGNRTRSFMLFNRDSYPIQGFDKASGTGELTFTCEPPPTEIGNRVWYDMDADGVQDPGEHPIEGVVVKLYDMSVPASPVEVATATTNADGEYYFRSIQVLKDLEYVASATIRSATTVDNDTNDHIGYLAESYVATGASAGNVGGSIAPNHDYKVEIDYSSQSSWMANTSAIADTLYPTVINSNGSGGTDATAYKNNVGLTTNQSDVRDSDGIDDDVNELSSVTFTTTDDYGENNHTFDFGFNSVEYVSLGDLVFYDIDNDGMYEPGDGESGVAGITLMLLDSSMNPVDDPMNPGNDYTTVTDSSGNYLFDNLNPGNYMVKVDPAAFNSGATLENYAPSTTVGSPNDNNEQEVDQHAYINNGMVVTDVISLTVGGEPASGGDHNPTLDLGFIIVGTVGTQLYIDTNEDGKYDPSVDLPIGNVELTLTDTSGNVIAVTTTDSNGYYLFENIPVGTGSGIEYIVTVTSGISPELTNLLGEVSGDSEGKNPLGFSVTLSPTNTDDVTADFGYTYSESTSTTPSTGESSSESLAETGINLIVSLGFVVMLSSVPLLLHSYKELS